MAKIGLIDVDRLRFKSKHQFPNLALMRISAWHKSQGDDVEWWRGDLFHYHIVYMSKVFSDSFSITNFEEPDPYNCDEVIRGGTGYHIHLINGREVLDTEHHKNLPDYIEKMKPDYTLYPEYDFAVCMTSRGCPRGCFFCHVVPKEGRISHKVANVEDMWDGQHHIECLDPNITACKDKHELFMQYKETKGIINFNQGLDIRMMTDQDLEDLNSLWIKRVHMAWDNPKDDLEPKFRWWAKNYRRKSNKGTVYMLTNYDSTMEENMYRIRVLDSLGLEPFVTVYDKPHAPREIILLQQWVNNKAIFHSTSFEDFVPNRSYYEIVSEKKREEERAAKAKGNNIAEQCTLI